MLTSLGLLSCIFVLVAVLIGLILWRSRSPFKDVANTPSGEPLQVFGHRTLEVSWTLGSLAMVALLFGLTVSVIHSSHPGTAAEAHDPIPDVTVIGHQWWWEVRYGSESRDAVNSTATNGSAPAEGIVTANEVHVPVGKRTLLALQAGDVIHDFWVPQLGPKQDMIPGQTTYLWLEPKHAGTYDGACAEFCGSEHAWMRIRVIAESPEAFASWQTQQRMPLASTASVAGGRLFTQYACNSCHAISGQGARVAPDLTHVAERQTLGAGVLQNSPEHLALWLKNPQLVKPQCNMPSFNLNEQDVAALTAYLEGLPSTTPPNSGNPPNSVGGTTPEAESTPAGTSSPQVGSMNTAVNGSASETPSPEPEASDTPDESESSK